MLGYNHNPEGCRKILDLCKKHNLLWNVVDPSVEIGNVELLEEMLKYEKFNVEINYLDLAAKSKNMKMVKYIENIFPTQTGLNGAVLSRWEDGIEYFESKGENDWEAAMSRAASVGWKEGFLRFADKGQIDWKGSVAESPTLPSEYNAVTSKNMKFVKFFIDHGATDWNNYLIYAEEAEWLDGVILFIEKGATNRKPVLFDALTACNYDVVGYLQELY